MNYKKIEADSHLPYQNQIDGCRMLPFSGYLEVWGIAKDHPTKLVGEVVYKHIDAAGYDNSTALQTDSKYVPNQPEALTHLITNYFESCLRMRNLNLWNYLLKEQKVFR